MNNAGLVLGRFSSDGWGGYWEPRIVDSNNVMHQVLGGDPVGLSNWMQYSISDNGQYLGYSYQEFWEADDRREGASYLSIGGLSGGIDIASWNSHDEPGTHYGAINSRGDIVYFIPLTQSTIVRQSSGASIQIDYGYSSNYGENIVAFGNSGHLVLTNYSDEKYGEYVLLTPIPEPDVKSLLCIGLLGFAIARYSARDAMR